MINRLYTQQKESLNGLSMKIMWIKYFGLQIHVILTLKTFWEQYMFDSALHQQHQNTKRCSSIHPSMSRDIWQLFWRL